MQRQCLRDTGTIKTDQYILILILCKHFTYLIERRGYDAINRNDTVSRLQTGNCGRWFATFRLTQFTHDHRETIGGKSFLIPHNALCHIFRDGNYRFNTTTQNRYGLCIEYTAETILSETLQLRIVRFQQDIAILESNVMESLTIIHTRLHIFQRQERIPPSEQHHRINKQRQQKVKQHTGNHDHQPLSGRLRTELIRFRRLCHRLLVHTLIDHTGYLAITSQRKPTDTILRITVFRLKLENREPRVKEKVKFLHPNLKDTGKDKMSEFVDQHQYR